MYVVPIAIKEIGQRENPRKNQHLWGIPWRKLGKKWSQGLKEAQEALLLKKPNEYRLPRKTQ